MGGKPTRPPKEALLGFEPNFSDVPTLNTRTLSNSGEHGVHEAERGREENFAVVGVSPYTLSASHYKLNYFILMPRPFGNRAAQLRVA